MGTSKALLCYKNMPLVEHMQNLLRQAGLTDVYISGDVPGYACIHDAVRHDGPGRAMYDLLRRFGGAYDRLLFTPVDMPLLRPDILAGLLEQAGSVYYEGYPLPACLETDGPEISGEFSSVRELLTRRVARTVPAPALSAYMININTQQEWKDIAS